MNYECFSVVAEPYLCTYLAPECTGQDTSEPCYTPVLPPKVEISVKVLLPKFLAKAHKNDV